MQSRGPDKTIAGVFGGFTLIELLVVIAIIAAASGIGVGLYAGSFRRLQVEKAARDFLFMAKYARMMAIEKQRAYEIRIDSENRGFSVVTTEWSDSSEQFEEVIVKDLYCRSVELDEPVRIEDARIIPTGEEQQQDADEQVIVFKGDGTAQTAVIQIGDGRTHYTISINAGTGRAKLHEGELEDAEVGTIDLDQQ